MSVNRRYEAVKKYRKNLDRKAKFHAFVRSNYFIWVAMSLLAFFVVVPFSCLAQIVIYFFQRSIEAVTEVAEYWIDDVRSTYASFASCMSILWQERGKLTLSGYRAMMKGIASEGEG